ncbi:hypothetical protein [Terracoccus sp. 273MFTsu3.1]|uniref:hypothetical protein n=1 Tax=Terracoccus sp. 273MFTsu3.1 TaxID=1172188 RepID=UPI0012DEE03B|nr:hypothetical protein [Terracoccus sp. 273MFTsu3.1]
MTTSPVQGPVLARVRPDAWRRVRYGLLVACLVLLGSGVLLGSAPSTFSDLRDGVLSGRVDTVHVSGGLPAGATGYSTVSLTWRDGGLDRFAEVVEASDPTAASPSDVGAREVMTSDVEQTLRSLSPGVRIEAVARSNPGQTLAGWRVPGWFPVAAILLWLATVALLGNGAQPWWGTRWAWFWALFSPAAVVTVPLFLLVSGPPPGLPESGSSGRRLTGGWAFILFCLVGPAAVGAITRL